jgi:hypothetical protein
VIAGRCPLCNGSMLYEVQYERTTVCVDCWDGLSGRARGATRQKWAREDQRYLRKRVQPPDRRSQAS